jgi:Sel1 repeat
VRSFWKITVPVAFVAVICGAAITWQVYKAKADARRLAEDAEAFRVHAEQGDAKAQFKLGQMYYHGEGVPQDYTQALRWYREAADQGDAKAQDGLAGMYYYGQAVPRDYVEAVRWYGRAAGQGYARAQYNLGYMYSHGKGVRQDYAEAARWYRKAADQGDARAQRALTSYPSTFTQTYLPLAICAALLIFLLWPQNAESRAARIRSLRNYLSWVFAISFLISVWFILRHVPPIIHRPRLLLSWRYMLAPAVFSVLAIVFGMTWLTVWKGKPSGKWWGIAASLTDILLPLCLSISLPFSVLSHFVVLLGIGLPGWLPSPLTMNNPRPQQ